MEFACPRCHFTTSEKRFLLSHLRRVKTCNDTFSTDSVESIIKRLKTKIVTNLPVKCTNCDHTFHTKQGLYHHLKNNKCSGLNQSAILVTTDDDGTEAMEGTTQHEEVKELRDQIAELKSIVNELVAGNSSAQIPQLHTTNQMNNTIIYIAPSNGQQAKLRDFGSENLSHISNDFVKPCLWQMNEGLVKEIHFNPDVPENHNVRLASTKQQKFEIWQDP